MRHVAVKICGLRSREHVLAAAEVGADYLGFVMTQSRRQLTPEQARDLVRALRSTARVPRTVGVFTDECVAEIERISRYCGFDLVQVSGQRRVHGLADIGRQIIRVLHVGRGVTAQGLIDDIERAGAVLHRVLPIHLLDTYADGVGGGTGKVFDWRIAREVSRRCPVMVAGGLTPANVGGLISTVRPRGVDVSSGVEIGGEKDTQLIQAFIDAVRKAEQEIRDAEDEDA